MMTYSDLLRNFKREIELAIHGYEALFANAGTDVPTHRGHNINALRRITRQMWQNNEDLLFKVNGVYGEVKKFKTGLYIEFLKDSLYETGRSRLKTALDAIINKPEYSKEAFLRAHIQDLESILASIEGIDPEGVFELRQALAVAQVENQTLAGINETLETQNRDLQENNERLKKEMANRVLPQEYNTLEQDNKQFQKELKKTRDDKNCLLGRAGEGQSLERVQFEYQAITSGEEVSMSFGTFGFSPPLADDEETLETQNNILEQENKKLQQQLEDKNKKLQKKNKYLLKSLGKGSSVVQNDAADASMSSRNTHSDSLLQCGLFNPNNPFNNGNDAADALASLHTHSDSPPRLPLFNPNNPFNND